MLIIDVGSNHGDFALEIAKRNRELSVLAIEPIDALVDLIINRKNELNIDNVSVVPVAIDLVARKANLNVANHHDYGVSSLLDFSKDKLKDEYWSTRQDMYFDSIQAVDVVPLSDILRKFNVGPGNRVGFIKIDAQGLDLEVLISAGDFIEYIDSGMMEVSVDTQLGLYKNEKNDLMSILNWLKGHGFKAYKLKPNDHASNEFNLYFCKNGMDSEEIESKFSLRGVDLYDGKFFWHFPSPKLLPVEEQHNEMKLAVERLDKEIEIKTEQSRQLNREIEIKAEQSRRLINIFAILDSRVTSVEDIINIVQNSRMLKIFFKLSRLVKFKNYKI
ncbi:FkbM family methyltransferase [Grimontia kaedaensis]|uniref:FkbM family methyltransferase n=1 Tax=Grimontia kaedaensis TaxID=2872157 RepID=A0ABY4WWK0_9GAMM|nr:FkbM family methyltransferase [Grimontia kaedaensis]USH03261.1 FkbM family methyltransferase [Grimontia kaedaensis]